VPPFARLWAGDWAGAMRFPEELRSVGRCSISCSGSQASSLSSPFRNGPRANPAPTAINRVSWTGNSASIAAPSSPHPHRPEQRFSNRCRPVDGVLTARSPANSRKLLVLLRFGVGFYASPGHILATSSPHPRHILATSSLDPGHMLARCFVNPGHIPSTGWLHSGHIPPTSWPDPKSRQRRCCRVLPRKLPRFPTCL
jgi:hypothetical protein